MNVAILGFGVVGSGTAEVISKNSEHIKKVSGADLSLKKILDIRDFPNSEFAPLLTKNFNDILNDDTISIVCETMGGVNPAFDFVSQCLKKGKHVVTSNKELVATKGFELLEIARKHNVNFLFEASVGGGIPIIRPISRCLCGNKITEVAGILNGTSNFILTKMIMDGMNFESALKLAQDNGYAEKDPTADVEGFDALRKICILSSLAFGHHVYPDGIYCEGISKITLEDVKFAESLGFVIKLIARAKKLSEEKIIVMVSPALVKNDSVLSTVNDVFNACLIRGDMTGDVVMYGKGAGKLATASAVVGDVVDCACHNSERKFFGWEDEKKNYISSTNENETAFFVRCKSKDKEKIQNAFEDITFSSLENKEEISFITKVMKEKDFFEKMNNLNLAFTSVIRVSDY